ncbi:hypothetical protein PLESTM_001472200 [Pleodorina starrii]|nr:hypothetical protein PLESTM_001472200 [Pleodorina starrii]
MFMLHTSHSSNKSVPQWAQRLTRSNPLANDHLEGHLLPAGLDLPTLQRLLLDSSPSAASNTTTSATAQEFQRQSLRTGPGGGAGGVFRAPSAEAASSQAPGRGGGAAAGEDGAPDLRNLTCEQLVRLCQPQDIISDLAGLTLIGQGRLSVACQALWRGARVAVKFSSSRSLHPSSSAIIRQALVSKALAHPNVIQHYSVRCCRLGPAAAPAVAAPAPLSQAPSPPPEAAPAPAGDGGAGGGGFKSVASAPVSSSRNAERGEGGAAAVAAAAADGGLAALHHLSGPAATAASANNAFTTTVSVGAAACGDDDACNRLPTDGQVEDLVAADPPVVVATCRQVAAAGAPPPLAHVAATAGGNRALKAPSQARLDAAAAATLAKAAASPPPPPHLHASVAAAVAAATGSPGCSLSFSSHEGFGNPFGSVRNTLNLDLVAALVAATEGDYLTAIITEYADKSTLHRAVMRGLFQPNRVWNARVALRALLRTALELAFALQHLHGRGVVHGSLRPANVLLKSANLDRRGFTAKVSNFSLARVCLGDYDDEVLAPAHPPPPPGRPPREVREDRRGDAAAADADAVADADARRRSDNGGGGSGGGSGGSGEVDASELPFWSPEQLKGHVVGKPSDVYAFGVTLYCMCTSRLPYTGLPASEVVRGVSAGLLQPQWPDAVPAAVDGTQSPPPQQQQQPPLQPTPEAIRALCAQCWQSDPRARPTFSQICARLQAIEYALREQLRQQARNVGGAALEFSGPQAQGQAPAPAAAADAAGSSSGGGGSGLAGRISTVAQA